MDETKLGQRQICRSVSNDSPTSSSSGSSDTSTDHENWKPFTLHPAFHAGLVIFNISSIILTEVLLARSSRDRALFFADDATSGQLPNYEIVCFVYLPTVLSVAHSLLWISVDHNLKLLGCFFHCSKVASGIVAQESLLVDYPFQNVVVLPFAALRRRHWRIFLGAVITLLATLIASPLMSFVLIHVDGVEHTTVFEGISRTLVPKEKQHESVSALFAHQLYQRKFLGQPAPRFMGSGEEFAVLPMSLTLPLTSRGYRQDEVWTVNTTRYEADLACATAISTRPNGSDLHDAASVALDNPLIVSNVEGDCSFTFRLSSYVDSVDLTSHPHHGFLMSHGRSVIGRGVNMYDDPQLSGFSLGNRDVADCTRSNVLLAVWNRNNGSEEHAYQGWESSTSIPSNFTALFCEPRYYSQPVEAHIDAASGAVLAANPTSAHRTSISTGVNSSYFEQLVTLGMKTPSTSAFSVSADHGAFDRNPFGLPTPPPHAQGAGFLHYQSMLPYAIADETNLDNLLNADHFAATLSRSFKQFFAYAVTSELTTTAPGVPIRGQRTFKAEGYAMDPFWSRVLQAVFLVIAVLQTVLAGSLYRRWLNMPSDFGSDAPPEGTEKLRDEEARHTTCTLSGGNHRLEKVRPREMSKYTTGLTLLGFTTLMTVVFAAFISDRKYGGLPTLSSAPFVSKLVYSYIPTLAAMASEGFLASLTMRLITSLPSRSLSKAIHKTLYFLATLITATILAIALGGIFYQGQVDVPRAMTHSTTAHPVINASRFIMGDNMPNINHAFYAALLDGYRPWTDEEYYFLPFSLAENDTATHKRTSQTAETWGFGLDVACSTIAEEKVTRQPAVDEKTGSIRNWGPRAEPMVKSDMEFEVDASEHCPGLGWTVGLDQRDVDSQRYLDANAVYKSEIETQFSGPCIGWLHASFVRYDFVETRNLTTIPGRVLRRTDERIQEMRIWVRRLNSSSYEEAMAAWAAVGRQEDRMQEVMDAWPVEPAPPPSNNQRMSLMEISRSRFGGGEPSYYFKDEEEYRQLVATPVESTHLVCNAVLRVGRFVVTATPNGTVLARTLTPAGFVADVDELVLPPVYSFENDRTMSAAQDLVYHFLSSSWGTTRADARPANFLEYLMTLVEPKLAAGKYGLASRSGDAHRKAMEKVLKRVFALHLPVYVSPNTTQTSINGTLAIPVSRVRVSGSMTVLVLAVLALCSGVVVVTYAKQPSKRLKC